MTFLSKRCKKVKKLSLFVCNQARVCAGTTLLFRGVPVEVCENRGEDVSSDIDVFIEIEEQSRQAKAIIRDIAWTIGLENEVVISPLVFSRDEIENSVLRVSPIVENILREGISL